MLMNDENGIPPHILGFALNPPKKSQPEINVKYC